MEPSDEQVEQLHSLTIWPIGWTTLNKLHLNGS